MLEIIHFSKTYKGGKKAVSDLNLEILPGDIYGEQDMKLFESGVKYFGL